MDAEFSVERGYIDGEMARQAAGLADEIAMLVENLIRLPTKFPEGCTA
jgi:hypothetical protein